MIITTQLGWKKKSVEIWSRNSAALAIPCCDPCWQPSAPWNRTAAWTSLPVTPSHHMPCLCDTICFLLQLFSSVVKHSSEMRPSTFILSQNPSLAPWVVCLPLSWIQEAAAASLWSCISSPSLSPLQSKFSRKAMPFSFQTVTSKTCECSPDQNLAPAYPCQAGLLLEQQ